MREKLKNNTNFIFALVKSAILGVIVSIVLVLVLAFVLKFVELSDNVITIIDEIIKMVSIFIATVSMVKKSPFKILLKSATLGAVYTILTFIVFSALRGSYSFTMGLVVDVVLGAVEGIIVAIILNVFTKEKVVA